MSELEIAEGLQTLLQTVTGFSFGDVVINDESLYDGAAVNCPYAIIYTASIFEVTPAPGRNIERYTIPIMLIEEFTDWKETYDNLRTHRQAITDTVFANTGWAANGLEGVMVSRVFNLAGIESVIPVDSEPAGVVHPVFLQQSIGVEVEVF